MAVKKSKKSKSPHSKRYTDAERKRVIDAFYSLEDRSERNIAKVIGLPYFFVNTTLTAYWKEKMENRL